MKKEDCESKNKSSENKQQNDDLKMSSYPTNDDTIPTKETSMVEDADTHNPLFKAITSRFRSN